MLQVEKNSINSKVILLLLVLSVAYNSSNDTIISGSEDTTVRVWDASSGKELNKLEGHPTVLVSKTSLLS